MSADSFRTNRGLAKMIFLSLITFGIYGLVVMCNISEEINTTARNDGKHTMNYVWQWLVFSWLTLGIAPLVWHHRICNRIGGQLRARLIPYSFDAADFWLWNVVGSLIVIGPFVFIHKMMKAMNLVNNDFNVKGA